MYVRSTWILDGKYTLLLVLWSYIYKLHSICTVPMHKIDMHLNKCIDEHTPSYHYKLLYVASYLKIKLTCINTHTYMHTKHAQLPYCLLYTWYKSHAFPKKVQNSDNRIPQCQYTSGNDYDTAAWTKEPIEVQH